ncbi:Outer membrane protein assembly factor BamB, contains PQQ-like beta-propeller repeat [Mariniphaga anaerophila]|uniref:Outer membrane protein assembly factor BamB, contains PQQ-like beta-propeller repeat n=1 Tax=Mariniphaga anaerophila TaxID=1484053 RepID=A0A1M5DQD4_9BACT|nr:PQQ-binding-like beta-propeller repeat protein [Mariniphaga anaerophila]SHF69002.1 Outer membrane protein assembly factor BamB, contains PQQ-like beta-propeller repeat [Mariniphaga anaerophila]
MTNNDKLKLAQNVAVISGVFCTVLALLLLLNFWQFSKNDPVESQALDVLVQRLKEEPNNDGLKNEIRNYDLLARKAYFNSQWQVKTGAFLLLLGAVVLAFALRVYYSLKAKIEEPEKVLENEIASRILAQKGVLIVGAVLFAVAIVASFSTVNYLEKYDWQNAVVEAPAQSVDEGIEVIDIAENVPQKEEIVENNPPKEVVDETPEVQAIDAETPVAAPAPAPEKVVAEKPAAAFTADLVKRNHNSFRGPFGQGISYCKNIPTQWDGAAGANILWKSPIPKHGYNSPVVWGDKVFVAGADNQTREVYCFNGNNGKLLWTGKADNIPGSPSSPPRVTEDTGLSAPTVTTDGQRVFAIFATGDVAAFNMDGDRVWAKNLGVPDNHYGHSSSLIVWDNKLIIQYDTNKSGRVLALNTATGEPVWDTARSSKISWASPVLAQVDGKYQVVLTADPIVAGYDVQTGKELWSVECMMGEVGPSVGYSDGVVYAANEYATLAAINIKTQEILWEEDMFLPEAASPLAHEGLLFIATSYGVLVCYDAKTGEEYWEHDVGKTLYSSPVYADGKLFMMDNDGVMRIYEFAKEMKLIAENKLGENAGTTPAFVDGRIYIRGEDNLYCIGK